MNTLDYLSDDEISETTGYVQRGKQQKALAEMRIPFRVNPKGRILVLRSDVTGRVEKPRTEPDWSAMSRGSPKVA